MVVDPPLGQATWAHWRFTQVGPASGGGGGKPPSGTGGSGVPTGAHAPCTQICSRPQSIALVQLGGAQTLWLLQLAPVAQSRLPLHVLPTGVQLWAMQLLPASQSPEREHCGSFTHCPAMHDAPALQSELNVHWVSTRPEQPDAAISASRKMETAVEKRTEDGRPCT
jgi:hypothetical protein